MKNLYFTFFLILFVFVTGESSAQKLTNRGREFWVAYGHHQFMSQGQNNSQQMTLYLATGDSSAVVTVQIDSSGNNLPAPSGGPWTRTYSIPANTVIAIDDPMPAGVTVTKSPSCIAAIGAIPKGTPADCGFDARLAFLQNTTDTVFTKKGIHITSTSSIVAYAHIYGGASSGATMLLPVASWGYNYTSINSRQADANDAYSWMVVIANQDNTTIEITPSVSTGSGKPAGVPFTVTLQKGHIYKLIGAPLSASSGYELTGTVVKSIPNNLGERHPVAVFSGSSRTAGELPCAGGGRDNDIQQCFPQETWGRKYLTAPMSVSTSPSTLMTNIYKVVVIDPTTVVRRNGIALTGLSLSSYYIYTSNTADFIEADKPVMVAQYMGGDGSNCNPGAGDPEMIYLSPVEQSINKTRFYRNTKESITFNYVTLIIPTNGLSSLKIDDSLFTTVPSSNRYSYPHPVLPGYSVAVRKWTATKSQCSIQSDSAFTGITYGLGAVESYGYNIGAYYDTINPNMPHFNTIEGSLFLDANANNIKDTPEPYFTFAKINSAKPGIDSFSTISSSGKYYLYIDTGSYVTKVTPYSPYYNVVPVNHLTTNTSYGNHDTADFAVQPIPGKRDLSLVVIPLNTARPGFSVHYKLMYANMGTDTVSGAIEMIKNSKLDFVSASVAPASIIGDTLRWTFSNLKPSDTAGIVIKLSVKAPPATGIGDTIRSVASISSSIADLTPNDNTSTSIQRLQGSFDPNDKTENHGGIITTAEVAGGGYLQYTIRFQNTGNDTAFNIYIRDTLDGKLDWSSLRMIGTSHDFQMTVNDGRSCLWNFNNINLVDSNTNEPLSHGFITFIIKPKATVVLGDFINNRAAIYFDANLPVLTNTEKTLVSNVVLPVRLIGFSAKKEGNINLLQWSTDREVNFRNYEIERSTNGRDYILVGRMEGGLYSYSFADRKFEKAINYYRLKMTDIDGRFMYSNVRSVNNTGGFYAIAYPNPAKDVLQLQTEAEVKSDVQLFITNIEGKILVSQNLKVSAGTSLKTINIHTLPAGHYILTLKSADIEQTVIKFEKL